MKQDKWTKQLHDKLAEHEMAAPEGLWADIEAALAQQPGEAPHPRPSRFVTLRRWAAVAAVAALTLGGGYWWWNRCHEPLPSLAEQSEAQILPSLQGEGCPKGGVGSVTSTLRQIKIQTPPLTPPLEGRGAAAQNQPLEGRGAAAQNQPLEERGMAASEHPQFTPVATTPANSVPDGSPVGTSDTIPPITPKPSPAKRSPLNSPGYEHPRTKTSPSRRTSPLKGFPALGLYAMNGINSQRSSNGVLMADALTRKFNDTYANSYGATTRTPEPIYLTGFEERQHHHRPISYGLTLSYPLTKRLSLTTGVIYTKLASDFTQIMRSQKVEQEQTLHYVGIPIGLNYQLWALKGFRAYASAGTLAYWNVATHLVTEGVTQELPKDRMQWGINGSIGAQYDIVPLLGVYVEPGLSYYPDNGSRLQNFFKDKPWNMSLQVGLRFNFGRNE